MGNLGSFILMINGIFDDIVRKGISIDDNYEGDDISIELYS